MPFIDKLTPLITATKPALDKQVIFKMVILGLLWFLLCAAHLVLAAEDSSPIATPSKTDHQSITTDTREKGGHAENIASYLAPSEPLLDAWINQANVRLYFAISGQSHHIPYNVPALIEWQQKSALYTARFEISHFLLGTRAQISKGLLSTEKGVLPKTFIDSIRGSESAVQFNRDAQLLQFSVNSPNLPLLADAQDQLSVIFQLGFWLSQKNTQPLPGSMKPIQLVSKSGAEARQFQYIGQETIDLPIGTAETLKIIRIPRSNDDQKATIWLLKNNALTLGRLRLEEQNGDFVDQKLSRIELLPR
jgi:hypothetical protein